MSTITIVQLYPEELGVAGDRGNALAVAVRLRLAGHAVTLAQYRVGDCLPDAVDAVIVGSGPVSAMRIVHADILGLGDRITALAASGVPVFAYGAGAELLGREIRQLDGSTTPGIGLFPFRATRTTDRKVGYIITDTEPGRLVGFEDHASRWQLDPGAKAFGTVVVGGGGNGDGTSEGVVTGESIATQVGGPALPLNPLLTDALIGSIARLRGFEYAAGPAQSTLDHYAEKAREIMTLHSKHVFSRI